MEQLYTIEEVIALVRRRRTSIYGDIKAGTFPPLVRIGGTSRWRESALRNWVEALPIGVATEQHNRGSASSVATRGGAV